MDRLWTPWRFDYIGRLASGDPGCVFCRIDSEASDTDNFVLFRSSNVFALLNLYPYTSGHLLIATRRHLSMLGDASVEESHELIDIARLCEHALRSEYGPEGFNIGFNLGRAAGAGVAHHLHMHVLPRWTGDANFLSVVGETRVLPEELPATFRRLLPYFSPDYLSNFLSKIRAR